MSIKLTKEQFLDRYGDVLVQFSSYYKYSFSYRGVAMDGTVVVVNSGGDTSSIYRTFVSADDIISVSVVDPYDGIASKDGETIASFYDY
jgi:hypothetical protein